MNCEKYEHLIDDLVEGELEGQTADQVNLHLFACQKCTSQFEMLQREKKMYAHYLFEIEPPNDLWTKFQTKLEVEKQPNIWEAKTPFAGFDWASKIFAFLRLNPALTTAALLVLIAISFSLSNFLTNKQGAKYEQAGQLKVEPIQILLPNLQPDVGSFIQDNKGQSDVAENKNKDEKSKLEITPKPVVIKQIIKLKSKKPISSEITRLTKEEKMQFKEIQALEIETVKQIEKVELLLRSFRNARFIEGSEIYDISYEKQQSRKLLQNNIELRQRAEIYGTLFTEEMLSKVEPYLLDIANLEINSSPEQVLEIKERVRNQNIIASLQAF